MKYHCYNPHSSHYEEYTANGIEVYEDWIPNKEGFDCYKEWVLNNLGPRPNKNAIVKRKNSQGNFEPGNLMWSSMRELGNTRRTNRLITFRGKTLSLADWCRKLDLNYDTVWTRIVDYKWPPRKALKP